MATKFVNAHWFVIYICIQVTKAKINLNLSSKIIINNIKQTTKHSAFNTLCKPIANLFKVDDVYIHDVYEFVFVYISKSV